MTGIPEPPARSGNPAARDALEPAVTRTRLIALGSRVQLPPYQLRRLGDVGPKPKYRDVYDLDAIEG